MSWLSKATGIHWGNIGPEVGAVLGSIIPGVGTALGAGLGGLAGAASGHQNNMAGNLLGAATGVASAIPSVAQAAQGVGSQIWNDTLGGGLSKVGNVSAATPTPAGVVAPPTSAVTGLSDVPRGAVGAGPNFSLPPDIAPGNIGTYGTQASLPATTVPDAGGAVPASVPGGAGASGGGNVLTSIGGLIKDPQGNIDWSKVAKLGLTVAQALSAASAASKAGQYQTADINNWNQGKGILLNPAQLGAAVGGVQGPTRMPVNAVAAQAQALQQLMQNQRAAHAAATSHP